MSRAASAKLTAYAALAALGLLAALAARLPELVVLAAPFAVVAAVGKLRREPLSKAPGIAEAVDWAEAATLLYKGGARWPEGDTAYQTPPKSEKPSPVTSPGFWSWLKV